MFLHEFEGSKYVVIEDDKDSEVVNFIKEGILEQARNVEFKPTLSVEERLEIVVEDAFAKCGVGIFCYKEDMEGC